MRFCFTIFLVFVTFFSLSAQWKQAFLQEDGSMMVRPVPAPPASGDRDGEDAFRQISGFPKGFRANATFKNLRNLTLADLDGDGIDEIISGIDDQLYVFKGDQLMWQKSLQGVAIYPPSVGDVDHDGLPEVVLVTGGIGATAAYLLAGADGSDLPNWPLSFSDHWLLTAPVLADVDGDEIMEIIIMERLNPQGNIHLLRLDGTSFNPFWPVSTEAVPAVTPSVGDVDQDGEVEIVVNSSQARYIFKLDGETEAGFPIVTHPRQRYSYQSPILADLDADGDLEIIGATHSDNVVRLPEFYIMQHDGTDYPGWPKPVPDQSWTYHTPTVVRIDGQFRIFMSRPIGAEPDDMLYCWDPDGNLLPGFPIVKAGGLEGLISIADIDGDSEFELVFGSNLIDNEGRSRIHAYELDGTGEVDGFPIHPYGWNYLNGAAFGDVDGNDTLDLAAITYTQTFNQGIDSAFINVYNLGVPYSPDRILWGTYKGSNTRQGLVAQEMVSAAPGLDPVALGMQLFPNPARHSSRLSLQLSKPAFVRLDLLDAQGRLLRTVSQGRQPAGEWQVDVDLQHLASGIYFGRLQIGEQVGLIRLYKL